VEVIRLVELEFVLFTLAPAVVLFAGIVLSTLGVWRIEDYRLLLLTAVLMLMAQHQLLELFRFLVQGAVVGGASEAIETGANVLATAAVAYGIRFAERQQQLRRKASASERRYRTITEQSPVPILVVQKYEIRFANEPAVELLGADGRSELDGRDIETFVHPDDREAFVEQLAAIEERSERFRSTAQRWQSVHGEAKHVAVSGGCATYDGEPAAFLVLRDLTRERTIERDLERSQERFRALFEQSSDAIVLIDPETRTIREANSRATDLLEYAKDQLIGLSIYAIHPHETDHVDAFIDDVQTEGTITTDRLSCLTKQGRQIPVEIAASVVRPADETMILASARDISERRRRERQLGVLRRVLRHNIRNDMNKVEGFAGEISDRGGDEIAAMADRIRRNAKELVQTSEEVRRLEEHVENAGDIKPIDITMLVNKAVAQVGSAYSEASIDVDLPDEATVTGTDALQVAIEHLIENAVKHNDHDPYVRVAVETEATGSDGRRRVLIRIVDDGPGIPASETITTSFEQDPTAVEHGTGFGLHIVSQIVETAGGAIDFDDDNEFGGTTATIRLPQVNSL
jgi:PAS domain S-box-containing protein